MLRVFELLFLSVILYIKCLKIKHSVVSINEVFYSTLTLIKNTVFLRLNSYKRPKLSVLNILKTPFLTNKIIWSVHFTFNLSIYERTFGENISFFYVC